MDLTDIADPIEQYEAMTAVAKKADGGPGRPAGRAQLSLRIGRHLAADVEVRPASARSR